MATRMADMGDVELFTSLECVEESNQLRSLLQQGEYPFHEIDLTARPDNHTELLQRFGQDFTVPGIVWNNQWFSWRSPNKETNTKILLDSDDPNKRNHELLQQGLGFPLSSQSEYSSSYQSQQTTPSSFLEQVWNETCFRHGFVGDAELTLPKTTSSPPLPGNNVVNGLEEEKEESNNSSNKRHNWHNTSNDHRNVVSSCRSIFDGTMTLGEEGHDSFISWNGAQGHDSFISWIGGHNYEDDDDVYGYGTNIDQEANYYKLSDPHHSKAHRRNSASALLSMMDDDGDGQNSNDGNENMNPSSNPSSYCDLSQLQEEVEAEEKEHNFVSPSSSTSATTTSTARTVQEPKRSTTTQTTTRPEAHKMYREENYPPNPALRTAQRITSFATIVKNTQRIVQENLSLVPLPNHHENSGINTPVTVEAMTRLLLKVLPHDIRTHPGSGKQVYSFRGGQCFELFSILFFQQPFAVYQQPIPGQDENEHVEMMKKMEAFAHKLLACGIFQSYTPHVTDFAKAFLVLQPLKQPNVLNTFVQWPKPTTTTSTIDKADKQTTKTAKEKPIDVILRLSRLMDEICIPHYNINPKSHFPQYNWHLFQLYEVACCQLQVVEFPCDKNERVAFLINLFNMIVRHAMILGSLTMTASQERQRRQSQGGGGGHNILAIRVGELWPDSLISLQDNLFSEIGYNVGGVNMTLSYLQKCLYGAPRKSLGGVSGAGAVPPSPELAVYVTARLSSMSLLDQQSRRKKRLSARIRQWLNPTSSCRCSTESTVLEHGTNVCFTSPIICNDPRLLMATTWGTKSSPTVSTLYPGSLDKGLCAAVQNYVRSQVQIITTTMAQDGSSGRKRARAVVLLPALLAWHRHDFGTDPDRVLETILPYMSVEQLRQINHIKNEEAGTLKAVFDGHFDWTPGIAGCSYSPDQPGMADTAEPPENNDNESTLRDVEEDYSASASCYTSHADETSTIMQLQSMDSTRNLSSVCVAESEEQMTDYDESPTIDSQQTTSSSSFLFGLFGRVSPPQASVGDDVAALPVRNSTRITTARQAEVHQIQTQHRQEDPNAELLSKPNQEKPLTIITPIEHPADLTNGNNGNVLQQRKTSTSNIDDISAISNGGRSVLFPCDVSEITYGSEFRDPRGTSSRGINGLWRSRNMNKQ